MKRKGKTREPKPRAKRTPAGLVPSLAGLVLFLAAPLLLLGACGPLADNPQDPGIESDSTLFRLVNQWGVGEWEEQVADGKLWITAAALKKEQAILMFYDDLDDYSPSLAAVFRLSHPLRGDLVIRFHAGNPDSDPEALHKEFIPSRVNEVSAGFPDQNIVVDLSEWSEALQSKDLYLTVEDLSDSPATGTISYFGLECYDEYPGSPSQTLIAEEALPRETVDGGTVLLRIVTADSLGSIADYRGAGSIGAARRIAGIEARPLGEDEYRMLREGLGVREEGKDYNHLIGGKGTGLAPPDEAGWEKIRERGLTVGLASGSRSLRSLPDFVDLSLDPAFPPVGDQGSLGSCASFTVAYYMKTYMEAKDRGWDLSAVTWEGGSGGSPSALLDRIMSPSFMYNLINKGESGGSSMTDSIRLVTEVGNASWSSMPYTQTDYLTWPDEASWREAPLFRGRIPSYSEYGAFYFLAIRDDEDIAVMKSLLAAGLPLAISVDADQYEDLDENDVWDADNYEVETINHGNTVVGYWDPGD